MNNPKHTPGPWTVEEQTKAQYDSESGERLRDRLTTFVKSGDYYVAVVMRSSFIPGVEGNARLIAAAPELLEALEAICQSKILTGPKNVKLATLMIKALAKATGESND